MQVTKSDSSHWTVTPANRANFSGKPEIAKPTPQMKTARILQLQSKTTKKNIYAKKSFEMKFLAKKWSLEVDIEIEKRKQKTTHYSLMIIKLI